MTRFTDSVQIGRTKQTKEGYLIATARAARTGVQMYLAQELGDVALDAGFKPNDVVRVYRHEDQVFSDDTLSSITRVPVTLNHPSVNVDASNWSDLAVGEVGDAFTRDGEWIVVNPMIKDAAAINAAKTTHKEISMGYEAKLIAARDGIDADFEMVDIKMNHLALVPKGRAGYKARIGDEWGASPFEDLQPGAMPITEKGGRKMSDQLKTVVLGDVAVQVAVSDAAAVEAFKVEANKRIADMESVHTSAIAAKDEEIGTLRAELKTAQDAASVDIDALVAARSDLIGKVKAIDSSIETAGKKDTELRRAAVVAKMGDAAVVDASDAEISGMFKVLAAGVKSPVADAIRSVVSDKTVVTDAQSDYVSRLTRKGAK